ncbi:hypothetical protein [Delftia acidovorans]
MNGWIILALIVGVAIGWVDAHQTVATECQKLGSFYVGKKVYRCTAVEDRND